MKLRITRIILLLLTASTICYSQKNIVWVEHEYSTINIANLDKTESKVLLGNFVHEPSTIFVDNEKDMIFWGNAEGGTIASTDNNVTNFTNHHRGLNSPRSMGVDNTNDWIYYGDASVARVERVRFDGSDEERLFSDNLGGAIYGLELDIPQNRMFFASGDNIHVSNLDGTDESIIVSNVEPESLVFDRTNERLYWSEPLWNEDGLIKSCKLDGSDIVTLAISSEEPQSIDIDFQNQIIYWSDPDEKAIYKSSLDGSNKDTLVDLSNQTFLNRVVIELDLKSNSLYYSTNRVNGIHRIQLDQEVDELFIKDDIDSPVEIVVDSDEKKIYIADEERGIISCNLDGSDVQELYNLNFIDGIAVDENYIYFVNWVDEEMIRMDKDGQNQLAIINDICCISDIAIENDILYWIDPLEDAIFSSNADGSDVKLLINGIPDARSMGVSNKDQKIYWTNSTINTPNNIISSSDLDGSNISTITDTEGVQYIGWLDIDNVNDKIYYSQGRFNSPSIYRINKDGSEKELVFNTDYEPRGVALYFDRTSTHDLSNSLLDIYPNPVSEVLNIRLKEGIDFRLRLFDIRGKLLIEEKNNPSINVSSLNNGMYLIDIQNLNSNLKILKKIMVIK